MTSVSSGGSMLRREDETETEVRRGDQDNINRFARLNARLNEVKAEREAINKQLEGIDDASTELMMMTGDDEKVLLMIGGDSAAFLEVSEEYATEHCENMVEKLQNKVDELVQEEADIAKEQAKLKTILYGRFGKSIQLEA
mmetsp:Transcript_35536/g.40479  ORF Transcript_35536/g.40479 Transcript_35536/m.40479 type:complete len:141 (+) Transcript_35536:75-497(+)|eukprot:CAMPEP_0194146896 /NCGR_PEP_ID=MMETSP0152-20130528/22255_1 /TAXON_ID=1049557 /ORGANISM="Thalassiothrix antarctica, Strain L6-D1" /LENGTH=140 /DNA_ID=CAMNT_0038847545 /DNA_START=57 /DNA_END=479 /DNA_ORIENTATION=-